MSQGNRDGKRHAREAVREAQLKRAAAERRRRQLIIAGVAVAVIALAVVIGVLVQSNKSSSGAAARKAFGAGLPFAAPAAVNVSPATAQDPGGIVYGPAAAKVTLQIWEDVRCPVCKEVETILGSTYQQYVTDGKIKAEYHLVDLIDRNYGGGQQGSLVGGNALACASDVGSAQFIAYHNLIYKDQPDETTDSYGSTTNMLNLAGQIDGLRGATFDTCATSGKYAQWVTANFTALGKLENLGGGVSTPQFYIDGTALNLSSLGADPAQWPASFKADLDAEIAKKG